MKHQAIRRSDNYASPEKKAGPYKGWRGSVGGEHDYDGPAGLINQRHHNSAKGLKHDGLS